MPKTMTEAPPTIEKIGRELEMIAGKVRELTAQRKRLEEENQRSCRALRQGWPRVPEGEIESRQTAIREINEQISRLEESARQLRHEHARLAAEVERAEAPARAAAARQELAELAQRLPALGRKLATSWNVYREVRNEMLASLSDWRRLDAQIGGPHPALPLDMERVMVFFNHAKLKGGPTILGWLDQPLPEDVFIKPKS